MASANISFISTNILSLNGSTDSTLSISCRSFQYESIYDFAFSLRTFVFSTTESCSKIDLVKYYSTSDLNGLLEELTSYGVSKEEGLTYIYLLGKFKPLYFKVVEGFLAEYLEDFNAKVKRIEK